MNLLASMRYLVALSDYPEPVGPSFWERDTKSPTAIFDEWSKENAQ